MAVLLSIISLSFDFGMLADRFSFNLLPYYILLGAVIIFLSSEYLNYNLEKYKII
ncbi:MAG: hypothetical protein K2N11_01710 [Mucispirillum sp.]|nr:hypothetical protein [Mucispirillum sp.]